MRNQSGLMVAEILVAIGIITIALVVVLQSFPIGIYGMQTGKQQSTAFFLAEQKLEQIKAWSLSTAAGQGFESVVVGGTCFNAGNPCASDAYNQILDYPNYRRTVTVSAGPTATTRVVEVRVFYQPFNVPGVAAAETQLQLATIIASR